MRTSSDVCRVESTRYEDTERSSKNTVPTNDFKDLYYILKAIARFINIYIYVVKGIHKHLIWKKAVFGVL